jgi:hypothetical protein
MRIRQIKFVILLVLIAVTIIYTNQRIFAYDMKYYIGKDNGYLSRVKSICILSTLFFAVMAEKKEDFF